MSAAGDGSEMGGPGVGRAVDGVGYSEENKKRKVDMDCARKQNEELEAKHECLRKNIVVILENQIDSKRKQLQQLTQLEKGKRTLDKSCDEDSNSKMVDESSAAETAVKGKADDENLKHLELELAKLDEAIQIKMDKLDEVLEYEKFSNELGFAIASKYMQTNMELEDIRKELIMELEYTHNPLAILGGRIGVKRMGEIDELSLKKACILYGIDKPEFKARILASRWHTKLGDPSWHPFKMVEADGRLQEVVDDNDAMLKQLRTEYGGDVYNIVKTAVIERNEYNPSGRYVVPELWNFEVGRKATVKEALWYLLRQRRIVQASAE